MKATLMKIQDIQPEMQKAFKRMPKINLEKTYARLLMNIFGRLFFSPKKNAGVTVTVKKIGEAEARIYIPNGDISGAGLLWIHGGGYIVGSAKMSELECSDHAIRLNSVVVSVEYRLAPKHPFPAAMDDCYAVWRWMVDNAKQLGVDPRRIAIAGQSAGGGLAAALCQKILDLDAEQPVAQCLYYPMLDDRTALDQDLTAVNHIGWDNRNNYFGWKSYMGQLPGLPDVPQWSVPARREDLSGLPPAWIGVGDLDLFFEENKAYAKRLEQAGVSTETFIVDAAPHGFDTLVPDAKDSKEFVASLTHFLKTHLDINTSN